ncbi:MAG: hypothetical protein J1F33_04860 [Clostridiales bacterium]|nr:hypothetical protein [Clostridiales bacterium]
MSVKKYFVFELKKALFAMGSIALIMTAISLTTIITDYYMPGYRIESGVEVNAIMGGILAAIVPVWMFSYKMKRRSVDLFYSLPLKRVQILKVKYLLGLIALYAPYTTSFVLSVMTALIKYPLYAFSGVYYIPAFFASLPALYCIYSIASFVFTRAERTVDGMIFIIFWALAMLAVMNVVNNFIDDVVSYHYMPTAPLDKVAVFFAEYIEVLGIRVIEQNYVIANMAVGFSITGLLAVASTVLLFLTEKKKKAENIGAVSESPFGYKVMIPLFTVCIIANLDIFAFYEIVLIVITASAAFMLSALYKHTFKIGKVQAIILAASVGTGLILAFIIAFTTVSYVPF